MKLLPIFSIVLMFGLTMQLYSQDNTVTPQRTAEQEAIKQTEKLLQEVNLTTEQAKIIYEINLRYARERQISNKRSEAVERMKNKNAEVQLVLSQEQYDKLQSKRYERTNTDPTTVVNQNRPINSSAFRTNQEYKTNQPVRVVSEFPVRTSFRPSTQAIQTTNQVPQTVRRSTSSETQNPTVRSNPSSVRSSTLPTPTFVPRNSEPSSNTLRK